MRAEFSLNPAIGFDDEGRGSHQGCPLKQRYLGYCRISSAG